MKFRNTLRKGQFLKAFTATCFLFSILFTATASASLIVFDFTFDAREWPGGDETVFSGSGRLTLDSSNDTVTSLIVESDVFTTSWEGSEPVWYSVAEDYDVKDGRIFYRSALDAFSVSGVNFNFDLWSAPIGAKPLEYVGPETSMWLDGERYQAYPKLSKVTSAVVPEPATLSLLALGLAAIGLRRRLV